ncbi:ChbG/HpnK family deacetylase [Synechococcus sp. GEYO]|uniref:ChbG/HpnK family deacetylase n=1 Tax=Synechococcus sp. GEYO TaxID=2575511 RepID=UPI000E0F5504|nr:ChbG/HpnK family deacetylase [Synechococcus sp. GEYO]
MIASNLSSRLSLYGLVGVVAAAVHALVLLGLGLFMPLWLANPLAFLAASLAGYLGHARFTFRPETGGKSFARRWLVIQYVVNLTVSGVLPLALPNALGEPVRVFVMVFTPTALNALIWSRAAQFSQRRKDCRVTPRRHADDLGLSPATNQAILELASQGRLDSSSLLVNGPVAADGFHAWQKLKQTHPQLQICLHLCLTEGPSSADPGLVPDLVNSHGYLKRSFGQWLLLSLLPRRHPTRRRIEDQLGLELDAQIKRFRGFCGDEPIHLDGHQHIHLVPIVLRAALERAGDNGITWMRLTEEPLPTGLPLRYWRAAIRHFGLLKWLVLQLLSRRARPAIQRCGLASNQSFAGVLFTGQMAGAPILAALRELSSVQPQPGATPPLLLAHPGAPLKLDLVKAGFSVSQTFAASSWRQREWRALQDL